MTLQSRPCAVPILRASRARALLRSRLDAYFEPDLNAWDTAAGAVLVSGAGGRVSALDGDAFALSTRSLLCSNGAVHAALLESLVNASCTGLDPAPDPPPK